MSIGGHEKAGEDPGDEPGGDGILDTDENVNMINASQMPTV